MHKLLENKGRYIRLAIICLIIAGLLTLWALALVNWDIFQLAHNVQIGDFVVSVGPGVQVGAPI